MQYTLQRALAVLRAGAEVEVAQTEEDGALRAALDRRDNRTLVVAGGDGSLHLTVSQLFKRGELGDTVLGLLPLGTGNDFARGTEIPLDVEDAARVIIARHVRGVDLIVDGDDQVVVNNVHLGIGADASRYGARWKQRLGRVGYPIGLVQAAFADPYRLRVTVDEEVVCDDRPCWRCRSATERRSVAGWLSTRELIPMTAASTCWWRSPAGGGAGSRTDSISFVVATPSAATSSTGRRPT